MTEPNKSDRWKEGEGASYLLVEPQTAVKEDDGKDADEENERASCHLVDRYRSI